MKIVNDFLFHDCFIIKDTKRNNEVLGLQINVWGETELSELYGNREVFKARIENDRDIWGDYSMSNDSTLVLYI